MREFRKEGFYGMQIEAPLKGERVPAPVWMFRALGAGIAIAIMELLAALAGEPLARVPFVTSIVLVMALPSSEAAGPRAILGGHLLSSACGFACLWLIGPGETASAAGVGLATFSMIAFRAIHPPAGIGAFLVPLHRLPASWLLSPVLAGALLLTVYAKLWQKAERWLIARRVI
jgi:CBS-domain-containing membrane protein